MPVIHCLNAVGYVLSSQTAGWKVLFSGDTRPCAGLVAAGKGSTIVIHEGTDGQTSEVALAKLKRYSDVRERDDARCAG